MDRDQILAALTALAGRLNRAGLVGEMYVVGGAAIALAYAERRSTRDIDAVFVPKLEIYRLAQEVGAELGLPPGWLNDAVKGFLAGDDPHAAPVLDIPGLRCLVASPAMLLALKVSAHRVGEDEQDVLLLAGVLGLDRADQVLAVAADIFGDRLDAAARFFVEELFAQGLPTAPTARSQDPYS
ncbi:MAG: DUF6036 family nucleotidyltransferase [Acidimicrobiales bacterium]